MHYITSLALAAALFSCGDALSAPAGSAVLHGKRSLGQSQAYRNNNGTFNLAFLEAELVYLKAKYIGGSAAAALAQHTANLHRRSFGTEALINYQSDAEYYGMINIGTPGNSETFSESTSSTYSSAGTAFAIVYGSGTVSGKVASETVSVANLTVVGQGFADITTCSAQFQGSSAGGILGLAFPALARSGKMPFVSNLVAQNALDTNLFGFFLSRGGASGSTLTIGALDATHYTGTIQYTPVTQQTYWKVAAASSVGGQAVGSSYPAAIDTGTTLIYIPQSAATAVYAAIPGAVMSAAYSSSGSDVYTYPCNYAGPIAFTFAGLNSTFAVDPRDFNLGYASTISQTCVGGIIGSSFSDGQPLAIIGDEFLKSWYSVYSFANGGSVGFAASAVPGVVAAPALLPATTTAAVLATTSSSAAAVSSTSPKAASSSTLATSSRMVTMTSAKATTTVAASSSAKTAAQTTTTTAAAKGNSANAQAQNGCVGGGLLCVSPGNSK